MLNYHENLKQDPIRVVVTGAAGQIAYSLLYQLAKGDVFGPQQPLSLHLLDIEPMMGVLNGVMCCLRQYLLWFVVHNFTIKSEFSRSCHGASGLCFATFT